MEELIKELQSKHDAFVGENSEGFKKGLLYAIAIVKDIIEDENSPTMIEIDFDGHLKCQIETTDKSPVILRAVNGYGQRVDCGDGKIRIKELT